MVRSWLEEAFGQFWAEWERQRWYPPDLPAHRLALEDYESLTYRPAYSNVPMVVSVV